MKRAALGALLISLVAGSTAMAGTVFRSDQYNNAQRKEQPHRQDNRNDGRRGNDHRNDRRNDNRNDRRNDHRDNRSHERRDDHRNDHRNDHRWNDGRHDDRNWNNRPRDNHNWNHGRRWENGRYHWGSYHRPHGYVVRHWARGDRLPRGYYAPTYVIGNYHECGLRRPPHGYHWVRVDHHAVLAVIATGVVLDVIYNQFW
jgi:Ni/Co efflux regulator RcnB